MLGCGSDREAEIKNAELRAKIVQLDVELRELKSAHQVELDALKKAVDQQSEQLAKMSTSNPSATGVSVIPSRTPEPLFTAEQVRSRDIMRAEALKRMEIQSNSRDGARQVEIVRQLYSTRTAEDVAKLLNEKHISNSNGGLWTTEEIQKMANDHKMEKKELSKP